MNDLAIKASQSMVLDEFAIHPNIKPKIESESFIFHDFDRESDLK